VLVALFSGEKREYPAAWIQSYSCELCNHKYKDGGYPAPPWIKAEVKV
jgi:hypothetical protein